jgi:hypothetical protein
LKKLELPCTFFTEWAANARTTIVFSTTCFLGYLLGEIFVEISILHYIDFFFLWRFLMREFHGRSLVGYA